MILVKISPKDIRPNQQLLIMKIGIHSTLEVRGIDLVTHVTETEYLYNPIFNQEKSHNFNFKSLKDFEVYEIQESSLDQSRAWLAKIQNTFKTISQFHEEIAQILGMTKDRYLHNLNSILSESRSFLIFMNIFCKNENIILDLHFNNYVSKEDKEKLADKFKPLFLFNLEAGVF